MTTEKTIIVARSVSLDISRGDNLNDDTRQALWILFTHIGQVIKDKKDVDFTGDLEFELSLEEEHWDRQFVARLYKVENE